MQRFDCYVQRFNSYVQRFNSYVQRFNSYVQRFLQISATNVKLKVNERCFVSDYK